MKRMKWYIPIYLALATAVSGCAAQIILLG